MSDWRTTLGEQFGGLDHVAIAVVDLDASVALYRDVMGFAVLDQRETRGAHTGMRSAVVRLGETTLVLVQGTEPQSQVSRFVEACGPGVQHIAIRVHDLPLAAETLKAAGFRFEMPMIVGRSTRQIFSVRDDTLGVRIELIERTGDGFDDRSIETLFRAMEAHEAW